MKKFGRGEMFITIGVSEGTFKMYNIKFKSNDVKTLGNVLNDLEKRFGIPIKYAINSYVDEDISWFR